MLENTKLLVIPDLNKFISSLDCSETVDIITNKPLNDYQVPLTEKTLLVSLLSCTEISNRVQLMLTPDYLIFCSNDNRLLYNATPIKHVSIQTARSDNELIGEYSFQLLIHTQKLFTMVSKFQDERNMWLGIDKNNNSDTAKSFSSWRPLKDVAEIYNATPKFRIDATQPIDVKDARTEETLSSVSSFDEEEISSSFQNKITIEDKLLPPKDFITSQPVLNLTNMEINTPHVSPPAKIDDPHVPLNIPSSNIKSATLNKQASSTESSATTLAPQSDLLSPPVSKKSKRSSFMKSVISAVSNRSSFILTKSQNKSSPDLILQQTQNKSLPNITANTNPSIDHEKITYQQLEPPRHFSATNSPEPPALPQHHTLPLPQSPVLYRKSMPSFTSITNTNHSNLNITPPLSRPSSPSATPPTFPRYHSHSASSSEDFGTPPGSPDLMGLQNSIKSTLYTSDKFKVFRWKDESWCTIEGDCVLEVRQTYNNRSCLAVHMKNTGQMYLNAWILPDIHLTRTSDTDLSLSLHISNSQSAMEDYLLHSEVISEVDNLNMLLQQMQQESAKMNMFISATSTLRGAPPDIAVVERSISLSDSNGVLTPEELAKTLKLAMQCKCKLFVQSSSSKWNSFGSVYMKISQQYSTKKMHIAIDSHKKGDKLVSAMVQSYNVERLSAKRVSFLLIDAEGRNSVVYMVQVREEATCDKIIEYIKTKNAESGW